jgi:hypothetical protein
MITQTIMKKTSSYFSLAFVALICATVLGGCYKETNPLDGLVTINGPIPIIRQFGALNLTRFPVADTIITVIPEAALAGAPTGYVRMTNASVGVTLPLSVVFFSYEAPPTEVRLYAVIGNNGTSQTISTTPLNGLTAGLDRRSVRLNYTIPAGVAVGTPIYVFAGVLTANGESLTGNALGVPTGTAQRNGQIVTITVNR